MIKILSFLVELLHCNDKINKVFRYFNIYLKNRELSNSQLGISEERRERGSESLIGQNVTEESKSNAEETTKTPTNEVDRGQSISNFEFLPSHFILLIRYQFRWNTDREQFVKIEFILEKFTTAK